MKTRNKVLLIVTLCLLLLPIITWIAMGTDFMLSIVRAVVGTVLVWLMQLLSYMVDMLLATYRWTLT